MSQIDSRSGASSDLNPAVQLTDQEVQAIDQLRASYDRFCNELSKVIVGQRQRLLDVLPVVLILRCMFTCIPAEGD